MRPLRRPAAALGLAAALCVAFTTTAAAEDLHWLWDQQCGYCHDHAGEFARKSLKVVDGRLMSVAKNSDVKTLLKTHNGGYSPSVIIAMIGMLRAQVQTPNLFESACKGCHGVAAQFVRESLVRQDGRLVGRSAGEDVETVLSHHGGLNESQAAQMLEVLNRIEGEVNRP